MLFSWGARLHPVTSAGTVASAWNDLDEQHISTDQPGNRDYWQRESDPATCFLRDPEDYVCKYELKLNWTLVRELYYERPQWNTCVEN